MNIWKFEESGTPGESMGALSLLFIPCLMHLFPPAVPELHLYIIVSEMFLRSGRGRGHGNLQLTGSWTEAEVTTGACDWPWKWGLSWGAEPVGCDALCG